MTAREQRDALDERGENQRRRLNAASRFRLTRHAFNRLAADATDAETGTDDGEAGTETGTDEAEPPAVARGFRGNLEQRVHGHESSPNREIDATACQLRAVRRRSSARPGPQRASPAARPDTFSRLERFAGGRIATLSAISYQSVPRSRFCSAAPSPISPMNTLESSVKMYACRSATNSSSIMIAPP